MHKRSLLIAALLTTALTVGTAGAASHMKPGAMSMGKMMTKDMAMDKDGMITKEAYLKHMSMMWDKADKEKKGKVKAADLENIFNTMGGG